MNFYDTAYQEPPLEDESFGLCDDQNGRVAYTDRNNQDKWIAIVTNRRKLPLIFTAIDKGVIKDDEVPERGRCDGMLTSDEHIVFVELKNQQRNWKSEAVEQLDSTIRFFIANHNITIYRHKKAYACNKKHPQFQRIENELNLRFYHKYGVRLSIQRNIVF